MTRPSGGRYTVYEAVNTVLQEIYVTATNSSILESIAKLKKGLPPAIAHWEPERQHIHFQSLEFELTQEEAQAFIRRHVAKSRPGWKYIV